MRKIIYTLIACCLLLVLPAQAEPYDVKDIAMVHLQDKTRFVCNPDGVLSTDAVTTMDSILYALEQSTGIETVVVAIKEMKGNDCFEFAYQLGQQNGVGKKKTNNGLVIFLCTDERCIQFATGYGIEGTLPDAICKRIQMQKMNPYFKNGEWDEGMVAGVRSVYGYLNGSMEFEPEENPTEGDNGFWLIFLAILGFGVLSSIVSYFENRKKSKCPKCKKHTLRRTNSTPISNRFGVKTEMVTYTCTNCGYTFSRKETTESGNDIGGRGGGPIIFGGGGFGGGGGSFGGGSFGGGSFGGGGAGSRF